MKADAQKLAIVSKFGRIINNTRIFQPYFGDAVYDLREKRQRQSWKPINIPAGEHSKKLLDYIKRELVEKRITKVY